MALPSILILVSVFSATVVAVGTHPYWAKFESGIHIILFARRMQWPLILLSLFACMWLIGLVVANRRRAWWLLGLLPVVVLFARFCSSPFHSLAILDNPRFITAAEASQMLHEDEYVVGLLLGDTYYAYPYATLYTAPVVVQPQQGRRMMLMWSPYANRATAVMIDRDIKPRELEIVSMPANALLIYNARLGQFINGLTGLCLDGEKPIGFGMEVSTSRMTWGQWVRQHPQTRVLHPTGRERLEARVPLAPAYTVPQATVVSEMENATIAMLSTTQPVAVRQDQVGAEPLNFMAGATPVLLFRDPATGRLRAFSRDLGDGLIPRFHQAPPARRAKALLVDTDTQTGWDANGLAVDADRDHRGQKLVPIHIEEDLNWAVMKYWYPELQLHEVEGP